MLPRKAGEQLDPEDRPRETDRFLPAEPDEMHGKSRQKSRRDELRFIAHFGDENVYHRNPKGCHNFKIKEPDR